MLLRSIIQPLRMRLGLYALIAAAAVAVVTIVMIVPSPGARQDGVVQAVTKIDDLLVRVLNVSASGQATIGGTLTASADAKISELWITGTIVPSALSSGTTEDWNPSGLQTAGTIHVQTNVAGSTLGGIEAPTDASKEGKILWVTNHGDGNGGRGTAPLTLLHRSSGSGANNRFVMPDLTDMEIPYTGACLLQYDTGSPGWMVVGCSNGGSERKLTLGDLRYQPLSPGALSSGNNNDYNPTDWKKHTLIWITASTGAVLTGLTYYGGSTSNDPESNGVYNAGYAKIFANRGAASILISCEDINSSIANRIACANGNYNLAPGDQTTFVYDMTSSRWRSIGDADGSAAKTTLNKSSAPSALASGETNDYEPANWGDTGTWRLTADAGGSSLSGVKVQEEGAVRILCNYGSGALTIEHQDISSVSANRFYNPGGANYNVTTGCCATFRNDTMFGAWFTTGKSCGIDGAGTANIMSKWTDADSLGNSLLTDDATTLSYNAGKFTIASATGNTAVAGTLNCVGGLTENSSPVLSGTITANTIPKGSGGNLADSAITDDGSTITLPSSVMILGASQYLKTKDFDTGTWDGSTVGATVISRDHSTMFWQGGLVVGQFANGTVPATGSSDGTLLVSSNAQVNGSITENSSPVLSGTITANTIPKGSGGNLADSVITDVAGAVAVGGATTITVPTAGTGLTVTGAGNETYFHVRNTSTGGRDWLLDSTGDGAGFPDVLLFYDLTRPGAVMSFSATGIVRTYNDAQIDGDAILGNSTTDKQTIWGHTIRTGTAPTVDCTGSATESITGTDAAGQIGTGAGATACTITFSRTYGQAPACVVTAQDGTGRAYTISATVITLTTASASSNYNYRCDCIGGSCQ